MRATGEVVKAPCLFKNIADPDDVYHLVSRMHEGKSLQESMELNARLILCLVNHIGDPLIIAHAVGVASGKTPGAVRSS